MNRKNQFMVSTVYKKSTQMHKYRENMSTLNGVLVKNSDMDFQMKFYITNLIKVGEQKISQQVLENNYKFCQFVTLSLQQKYPGPWVCAIGKKFAVNICNEPGFFVRISTQNYHYIIYQLRKCSVPHTNYKKKKEND